MNIDPSFVERNLARVPEVIHPVTDAMAASPATPSLAERAEEGDGGTEWFYVDGAGVRRGPHNFRVVRAQLRCGVLDGDDLVWREGLPAWRPAAEIPVFASCVAGRAGAAAESVPARDDASPPERDDAATPDRARESAPVAAETLDDLSRPGRDEALELDVLSRPRRDEREPTRENLSACWHASRSDGARFGPVDAETLVRLLAEAEAEASARDAGEVAETLVWHPAESAAWGPVEACPSLAAILALRRREARASRSSPETAKDALAPPASPHGVARRAAEAGGFRKPENRNGVARQTTAFAKSVESPRRVLALEAELAETREALGSARFEIDALEAELASTRERAAEATAFAREAARATAATEDLAAARAELETRTAELSRLRGVLKGKLLARVLAEADDTRERVEELDALDAEDGGDGVW